MALYGDLSEISLADLLYLINWRQLSGRLTLQSGHDDATLWFRQGQLVHVASSRLAHHLGQWLVRRSRVTLAQLGEALTIQATAQQRQPLGSILVERGWLSAEELSIALTEQAEEILFGILAWPSATFTYSAVSVPPTIPLRQLSIERIVLEAARRADEWSQIRQTIPHLDCSVTLVDVKLSAITDTLHWQARMMTDSIRLCRMASVNGQTTQLGPVTLRQIVQTSGMEEQEVMRLAYELARREALIIGTPHPGAAQALPQTERAAVAVASTNGSAGHGQPKTS